MNVNETEIRYRVDVRLKRRPERCRHMYKVRRMRVKEALPYLISHESHHRGQIALYLKQAGHPLDKKTLYGMREQGVR